MARRWPLAHCRGSAGLSCAGAVEDRADGAEAHAYGLEAGQCAAAEVGRRRRPTVTRFKLADGGEDVLVAPALTWPRDRKLGRGERGVPGAKVADDRRRAWS